MKFFHVSDVHLGAEPDRGFSWSNDRSREIWDSFRDMISQVGREHADLLLIAGDLFHRQPLLKELKEVNYLFSSIPETRIVLMAGNHDYLKKNSCYRTFAFAENVTCLWGEQEPVAELPEIGTAVYGISYDSREITVPVYHDIRPMRKQPIEILLAHGGDETHIPFQKELLLSLSYDYIALGHIHKPQILFQNKMAYAGALEPLDKNDTGMHGYIKGTCQEGKTSITFVPAAKRSYKVLQVPVNLETTQYSLEVELSKEMEKEGRQNLFLIDLSGRRSAETVFYPERLKKLGNVREVVDRTRPAWDKETLLRQYEGSLVGEYIRHFMRDNLTDAEEKAFEFGIEALLASREV